MCINVGEVQTGNARNNVAGMRPTPAYKDIVYITIFICIKNIDL